MMHHLNILSIHTIDNFSNLNEPHKMIRTDIFRMSETEWIYSECLRHLLTKPCDLLRVYDDKICFKVAVTGKTKVLKLS